MSDIGKKSKTKSILRNLYIPIVLLSENNDYGNSEKRNQLLQKSTKMHQVVNLTFSWSWSRST